MASQVYEFNVKMECNGCANAITNVLKKKEGVTDIKIDLEGNRVSVTSILPSDDLLQVIKKTGMECQFLGVKK